MTKKSALLTLALLCSPLLANAGIITLEYAGHVTTSVGTGAGHTLGESVSGKLEIDLSKASSKYIDTPTSAGYFTSSSEGVVVGDTSVGNTQGYDLINIYNGSHVNWFGQNEDFLQVIDALPTATGVSTENLQITLTLNGSDWLTDLSLNNINIITNDSSVLGFSFGAFNRTTSTIDAYGNPQFNTTADIFSLDSLKLVSSEVPEPSSIALFALGGLAFCVRRRRMW